MHFTESTEPSTLRIEEKGDATVAVNLVTQLLNDFRGDSLGSIASAIGESPARTQSAFGAVIPALIGGLAMKAATTDQASNLLDVIKRNKLDSDPFADASSAFKAPGAFNSMVNMGRPLMDSIFGGRTSALADWAAAHSGVNRSSASSLFSLVLPIVLGMIARHVRSAGWNASNLMSLLDGQRAYLHDAPAGLTDLLRVDDAAAARHVRTYDTEEHGRHVPVSAAPAHEHSSRSAWLWVLPLLFLIPLLGYFMTRNDEPRREAAVQLPSERAEIPTARVPDRPVGTTSAPSARARVEVYRIEFDNGSRMLTAASAEQLRNVVEFLKANPRARITIAGYTDDTGNDAANMTLSQARAAIVMHRLASLGIDRSRMTAEGFGETDPVADNTTPDGRHNNRRVEIRVTEQ